MSLLRNSLFVARARKKLHKFMKNTKQYIQNENIAKSHVKTSKNMP